MHEFDRCIGVELLENLHLKSLELKEVYERAVSAKRDELG
jgi:hypothetical protein